MKKISVQILKSIAGLANPDYGMPEFGYTPGEIVELHPDLASKWIASGIAKAVDELTTLREELERKKLELEIKRLHAKLAAPHSKQTSGAEFFIWHKTRRELTAYIDNLFVEAQKAKKAALPIPPDIPREIGSAGSLFEACVRYAPRCRVRTRDGKFKKVNGHTLYISYKQQFR